MRQIWVSLAVGLSACLAARAAVAPIPETDQAGLALKIIDAYHGARPAIPPKKLHVVYFAPSDGEPAASYRERLAAILEDIRAFYGEELKRLGFGGKTFTLPRDGQGELVIHFVKGKHPEADFPRWVGRNGGNTGAPEGGDIVLGECRPALEAAGISPEHETILIFCHLAKYDETAGTFRHHSPYFGSWSQQSGLCFAADWAQQDLNNLVLKKPRLNDGEYGDMSLGKHMTIFLGGIAHELGHAFALPHCGERWDEKVRGTSLMGAGNHTYREERRGEGKGSFLTMASAMRLASRPLFSGSDQGETEEGRLQTCELLLSTNVTRADLANRRATLRLEGSVAGSPPVYAVIAYFDSLQDGGYRAPTATSVPDAQGRFAIEVSDLAPCGNGELRVEFCHANGAVSSRRLGFSVTAQHGVDLSQWELRRALEPVDEAVARNERDAAQVELRKLETSQAPESAKAIARKLVETLSAEPKPIPGEVPGSVTRLALGEAQFESAQVGWLQPAADRVPTSDNVRSALLDSGKIYATGLYAHAPSHYVFKLDGKWQQLSGEAGLHSLHQPYGSVVFVIQTDGREAFRSPVIRRARKASYKVDLTGVKKLELFVEPAGDGNGNDWGLWLEPSLSREAP